MPAKNRKLNTQYLIYTICTLFLLGTSLPLSAQLPAVSHLTTIQTAEPIGKGGTSTTFGLLQYAKVDLLPDLSQRVDIGGFEESHRVTLEIETFLVPVRFAYGLSDELDLILGGTFSTGGVRKVVHDFYGTNTENDQDPNVNRRVYDQPLLTVLSDSSTTSNPIAMTTSQVSPLVETRSSVSQLMTDSTQTMNSSTTVQLTAFRF